MVDFPIIPVFLGNERKLRRYIAEHIEEYIKNYHRLCLGRYKGADIIFDAILREGLLGDKQVYCTSRRTKALGKMKYGLKEERFGNPQDLIKIRDDQIINIDDEEDLNRLLDENLDENKRQEIYIICGDGKGVQYCRENGFENVFFPEDFPPKAEEFFYADGLTQVNEKNDIILGPGIKYGFPLSYKYPPSKLKELISNSKFYAAITKNRKSARIGDDGKEMFIEFKKGKAGSVIESIEELERELGTKQHIVKNTRIIKDPFRKNDIFVTQEGNNIMAVTVDPEVFSKYSKSQIERIIELNPDIGRYKCSIIAERKPDILFFKSERGFDSVSSYYTAPEE